MLSLGHSPCMATQVDTTSFDGLSVTLERSNTGGSVALLTTTTLRDGEGRVRQVQVANDGAQVTTHFEYDPYGNLSKTTGPTG